MALARRPKRRLDERRSDARDARGAKNPRARVGGAKAELARRGGGVARGPRTLH